MPISEFFKSLGARLVNIQWSWGSISPDGTVFLRAWQDECFVRDRKTFIRLVNHAAYADDRSNLGYPERLRHLAAINNGAEAYVVMLKAVDPAAQPRAIASYNDRDVFRLGEIINSEGDQWGELAARVPASSIGPA